MIITMKLKKSLLSTILVFLSISPSYGQIADIVNGLTNAAMPAIRGGNGYKGYVETDYTQGFGNYRSNFATLATTQGYMFNDWLFVGAGIGVDLLWSKVDKGWGENLNQFPPQWQSHEIVNHAVMIPVFTDFRFILGQQTTPSFFLNLRVGAAFLCSDDYVKIANGYLTNQNYFYFQPAVGVRVPINKTKPRQAVDFGIHYRLMTSNYWSNWQRNAAINGLGVNVSYEW